MSNILTKFFKKFFHKFSKHESLKKTTFHKPRGFHTSQNFSSMSKTRPFKIWPSFLKKWHDLRQTSFTNCDTYQEGSRNLWNSNRWKRLALPYQSPHEPAGQGVIFCRPLRFGLVSFFPVKLFQEKRRSCKSLCFGTQCSRWCVSRQPHFLQEAKNPQFSWVEWLDSMG